MLGVQLMTAATKKVIQIIPESQLFSRLNVAATDVIHKGYPGRLRNIVLGRDAQASLQGCIYGVFFGVGADTPSRTRSITRVMAKTQGSSEKLLIGPWAERNR